MEELMQQIESDLKDNISNFINAPNTERTKEALLYQISYFFKTLKGQGKDVELFEDFYITDDNNGVLTVHFPHLEQKVD